METLPRALVRCELFDTEACSKSMSVASVWRLTFTSSFPHDTSMLWGGGRISGSTENERRAGVGSLKRIGKLEFWSSRPLYRPIPGAD